MRTIRIVAVGKIKGSAKYLETGIALYAKRITRHIALEWIEVPEVSPTSTRTVAQCLEQEAQSILKYCDPADTIVLLDERGEVMDSQGFSRWLLEGEGNPLSGGRSKGAAGRMIFIIGGAYGTSERLREKATVTISLSKLTLPHQLVRLVLVEQLYRALTIYHNEPYHK